MKKSNVILMIFILTITFISCNNEKREAKTENKVTAGSNVETADYEIVKVEDQSRKAFGEKPSSQYEISEIEKFQPIKKFSTE